jgi:hypothetical protein
MSGILLLIVVVVIMAVLGWYLAQERRTGRYHRR